MKIARTPFLAAVLTGALALSSVSPAHAAPASDDAQAVMTTTMGTLIAQGLLMTYMSLGAVADGFSKKAYSVKEATEVLDTCQRTTKVAQDSLKKLLDSGAITGESDLNYLRQSIAAYDDLTEEATDVKACVQNMSQANIKKFMSKKDEAWKKITALIE